MDEMSLGSPIPEEPDAEPYKGNVIASNGHKCPTLQSKLSYAQE